MLDFCYRFKLRKCGFLKERLVLCEESDVCWDTSQRASHIV